MHVTTGLVGDHHAAEMNANGVATVNVRPDWLSRTRITATSGGSASRALFFRFVKAKMFLSKQQKCY